MTVEELIEKLKEFPPDANVYSHLDTGEEFDIESVEYNESGFVLIN